MMRYMAFEKPREFVVDHKLLTSTVIGSAAAAAAVTGYAEYRKRKLGYERELDENHAAEYESHLSIFEEDKLPEEIRREMARIAAHIYYANEAGADFVTGQSLRNHFAEKHGEVLSRHRLDDLAGHLKHHKIIGRVRGSGQNSRSHGYANLPALEWAMNYSNEPHLLLREAVDERVAEITDNS
jgi:hypothetical protein